MVSSVLTLSACSASPEQQHDRDRSETYSVPLTLAPETGPWGGDSLRSVDGGSWIAAALHDEDRLGLWHIDGDRNATEFGGRPVVGYHPDDVAVWDDNSFVVAVEGLDLLQRWAFNADSIEMVDEIASPFGARNVSVVDIDGDGHMDLVLAPYRGSRLAILWGQGGFNFSEPQFLEVGLSPWHPLVADWYGDGRLDLVVGVLDGREINVARNLGGRQFDVETVHRVQEGANPRHMALGDVAQDGYPHDLVIAVELGPAEVLLRGARLVDFDVVRIAPERVSFWGAAVLADGTVVLGEDMRVVLVRLGQDGVAERRWLSAGSLVSPIHVADLDGDGYEDLVAFNSAGGGVTVHFGPLWENARPFDDY